MAKIIFGPFLNHPVAPFSVAFNTTEILSQVSKEMKCNLVIATPSRDMLLFSEAENERMISDMKEFANDIYESEEKVLSKNLLYYNYENQLLSLYEKG